MVEQNQKVERMWLQCQMPRPDWDAWNERRAKLGLKWADLIVPGTLYYLEKLEREQAAKPPEPVAKQLPEEKPIKQGKKARFGAPGQPKKVKAPVAKVAERPLVEVKS